MTVNRPTNRTSPNVARRHGATRLRGGSDKTFEGHCNSRLIANFSSFRIVEQPMASLSRRFIRHQSRITACELLCQSEQNPIGFFADSGLLEQRI
ncbi:hypothetical protein CKO51_12880 [Rhodopirellula sp. SM50]|nr:hypothetical protein CKO51_12880 [Rhodopirellula sp. SM50]